MANGQSKRKDMQRHSQSAQRGILCVPSRMPLRPLRWKPFVQSPFMFVLVFILAIGAVGQTRQRKPAAKPATQQAPKASPTKYSAFQHSTDKHKSLACNTCHKVPTSWTAKRDFPSSAAFPNHPA